MRNILLVCLIIAIIIAGAVGGILGTLVSKTEVEGAEFRVDFINFSGPEDPAQAIVIQGLKDVAEGYNIDLVVHWTYGEIEKFINAFEQCIAIGTDAIIYIPTYPEATADVMSEAVAENIALVSIQGYETTIEPAFNVSFAPEKEIIPLYYVFKAQFEGLEDILSDDAHILLTQESLEKIHSLLCRSSAEYYYENECPTGKTLEVLVTTDDPAEAQSRIEMRLLAGGVDGIMTGGMITGAAAYLAEEAIGLEPGEIPISVVTVNDVILDGIQEGYIHQTINISMYQTGYVAMSQLYPYLKWGVVIPDWVIGLGIINENNVDMFRRTVELGRS